ncbi:MAG: hypothetical protein KDD82_26650 [Planctomycetes bacterium]|nr:hypothetical protein [Planctomycetota bacterium]
MSRLLSCALGLALLAPLGCVTPGGGADAGDAEQVDRLGLAALLIKDGHPLRAGAVLDEVDLAQEGLDLGRYWTLRGLVAFKQPDYPQAREAFGKALALPGAAPSLRLYLAQAHYALQDFSAALSELERCPQSWADVPDVHRMRVDASWRALDRVGAFAALEVAEARFPTDASFAKQRLLYLLELGLYGEASRAGRAYVERAGESLNAYLAWGEALRRSRRHDEAARVLEDARLRYPGEAKPLIALAHAHLSGGRPLAAGYVMEQAARLQPELTSESAELYRRGGDLGRALYLNAQLSDQAAKTRQRLSILLERDELEQAAALAPRLSRLGLLEDDDVRYALAYAHFRTGELDLAEEELKGITKRELFSRATDLRKAIEAERAEEAR